MEDNLDTMYGSVTKFLNEVSHKIFNHSKINSARFSIPVKEYYKSGGTLSMAQGNVTGQVIKKGMNKYGRWPCKVSKKEGITTYHQQVALIQQDGCTISPRKAFTADLMKWLKESKKKGEQFIFGSDFNEVLRIGSTLLKICTNKNVPLVDSLASKERENKSSSLSG
eukprot:2497629-Ditylum_brightwellii.AAC.1